jgi:4'-phosphopantetheinyl transferase
MSVSAASSMPSYTGGRRTRAGAAVVVRWIAPGPEVAIPPLERLLDASERARAERFHFAVDRDAYVAAHALLRATLSEEAGLAPDAWRFRTASGGKPEIDPSLGFQDLRFSLSHTRGMAACAVGHADDLGVDVEAIDPSLRPLELARQFLAPSEAALLGDLPPARRHAAFYRIWTLKEAYLKATGQGIAGPLDGFAFSLDPVSVAFAAAQDHPDRWQFAEIAPGPSHLLALAVRRHAAEPIRLDQAEATDVAPRMPVAPTARPAAPPCSPAHSETGPATRCKAGHIAGRRRDATLLTPQPEWLIYALSQVLYGSRLNG